MKYIKKMMIPAHRSKDTPQTEYGIYELTDDEVARNGAPGKFVIARGWKTFDSTLCPDYVVTKSEVDAFVKLLMHYSEDINDGYAFGNTVRECELEIKANILENNVEHLKRLRLRIDRIKATIKDLTKAYSSKIVTFETPFVYGEDVEHGKED